MVAHKPAPGQDEEHAGARRRQRKTRLETSERNHAPHST